MSLRGGITYEKMFDCERLLEKGKLTEKHLRILMGFSELTGLDNRRENTVKGCPRKLTESVKVERSQRGFTTVLVI